MFLLHDFLINSAKKYPDKIALVFNKEEYSYKKLLSSAKNLAGHLNKNGVGRGDRVIIHLENGPEVVIAIFGTLLAGGAFMVINYTTKENKFKYIVSKFTPSFIITDSGKREVMETIGKELKLPPVLITDETESGSSFNDIITTEYPAPDLRIIDNDLASIICTSGSTGDPKGVTMTHRNMVSAARSITSYLENVADDIILNVLPLSFDYGLYQVLMTFLFSGTIVLQREFGYPFTLVSLIRRHKISGLPCVPTMMAILLQLEKLKDEPLNDVRYVSNTGAAMPPAYIPRLKQIFPKARIYSMYGLTECKRVSYLPPNMIDKKPDSVGIAMPNTEVFVADKNGRLHSRNAEGELVVRGASVMREYWNDPEGTAEVLKPGRFPGENLLYTGDQFKIDKDGFLYFKGRMDDIIKSRGERVSPKEIENVIYGIEDVVAVRVSPVPDEIMGNIIKAEIVLRAGSKVKKEEILKHCRRNLENLMVPKKIEIVDKLPISESGKIKRK
jgi:amino acid adenylation domain-containing protein